MAEGPAKSSSLGPSARNIKNAGVLATGQQSYDDGLASLTESKELSRELSDQALGVLELVVPMNAERAQGWLREALSLHEAANNQFGVSRATGSLGMCELAAGNFPEAIHLLQQSLESARQLQDVWGEAFALTFLGWAAMMRQDPEPATLKSAKEALLSLSTSESAPLTLTTI